MAAIAASSARSFPAAAPAINRAYNFAATWEKNAPLSEEEQAAVAALGQAIAERPLPSHIEKEEAQGLEASSQPSLSSLTEVVLLNSHQFYKWYADLESAMKSETEEKYRCYVDRLSGQVETCNSILKQLDDTIYLFDDLQAHHGAVTSKTKALHDACERLVLEKDRLVEFADTLRAKLKHFDELEKIAAQFYSPSMSASNDQFLPLLKTLDECIQFVSNNPQYADSSVYLVKFKQLQGRALGMIRSHVQAVLKSTSQQVQAAVRASSLNGGSFTPEMETSVLYVRFKTAANELKVLMPELESRGKLQEYSQLLSDCHALYCEMRVSLVKGVVHQRVSDYAKKESLPSFSRSGCSYLMQVCQLEYQLFDHFFPSSSLEPSNLAPLTDPLCTFLYDALRPKYIQETSLDLLCELVDILKFEVLEEQLGRRGDAVAGLRPTIVRILADVQERLTFRVQTYMRNEVVNYLPMAEDLDYPDNLQRAIQSQNDEAYSILYPPLEKTLACLAKLYRRVEPEIFTGLAQEAVGNCAASIQKGSKLVVKKATEMDGQLFLIKHLLVLREQIAPFDIDFAATHKELDFAHVLDHLRRIMRGQASLFDFTSRSTLARTLSPRVLESQVDAKKELEKSLKATCEQFIMFVTKIAVEPMLSFITKVTAFKVAFSSRPGKALKEQAFATPDKVAEMASKVGASLKEELPRVVARMKLYLQSASTRSILFKPIKTNIIEAHNQVVNIVKTEYASQDKEAIQLMDPAELQTYLDSLS